MKYKVRIGIVGLGAIARNTHIPALRALKNAEIVSGAEKNPERRKRIEQLFGLRKTYDNYEEMYKADNIDAVYICLPNFLHFDATIKALNSGLHVLCEKPVGISSKEVEEMLDVAKLNNLIFMSGYQWRFAKNFLKAKEIIESGILGKIIQVQAVFMTPGPYLSWDPKSDWYLRKEGHGVLYDIGCHIVNLLQYLVPFKIESIYAKSIKGYTGYETLTNIACSFSMEGSIMGSLSFGWRAANDIMFVSIHGTAGSITVNKRFIEFYNRNTLPTDRIKSHLLNAWNETLTTLNRIKAISRGRDISIESSLQSKIFIDAIQKKDSKRMMAVDALQTHRVLEAILFSVQQCGSNLQNSDTLKLREALQKE